MKRELEHNVTENTFQTPLHPVQLPPVFHALAMSIQEKKTTGRHTHFVNALARCIFLRLQKSSSAASALFFKMPCS